MPEEKVVLTKEAIEEMVKSGKTTKEDLLIWLSEAKAELKTSLKRLNSALKGIVDMDKEFHVTSLSRDDILAVFGEDDEDPYYIKVKTLLESISDDDMGDFVHDFGVVEHTNTVLTDRIEYLIAERLGGEKRPNFVYGKL